MEAGIVMGLLAAFALIMLFMKSPRWLQTLLLGHPLLSEILSIVFFFASITSITSSETGVMAAFTAGAIWTAFFFILRYNRNKEHDGNTGDTNASTEFRRSSSA